MEGGPLYKKKNLWRVDNKDLAKIRESINSGLSGNTVHYLRKKWQKNSKENMP